MAAVTGREGLDALVQALTGTGRTVVGPAVRDGAAVPGVPPVRMT
ncbi:hypothetical protein [Streptomyces sp. YIM 98790]|nr:hypothetical protein [Streptomyces sp. YIM 98790]